ncbi:MAG: DUF3179 domain-containing (seleno)protein [bacterium]|nr:DUF3179 domain-containing (seleno)protein [bacterium]
MFVRRVCIVLVGFVFLAAACSGADEQPAGRAAPSAEPGAGGGDMPAPPAADPPPAAGSDSEDVPAPDAAPDPDGSDPVAIPAPPAGGAEDVVELEPANGAGSVAEVQETADGPPEPDGAGLHPIESATLRNFRGYEFPPSPEVPVGPLGQTAAGDLETVWSTMTTEVDLAALSALGESGDARLGWILSDLLRFFYYGEVHEAAVSTFETLTGVSLADDPVAARSPWQSVTDHLIAWDLPAFEGYVDYKERLFTLVEPGWQPFFDDRDANIDWRLVSWGGVRIDDRPLGDPERCVRGCIPARDDPPVTDAAGGAWYPDDRVVFAVVIGGEARAYPKNFMEIHEMVNDTLGGRRIGFPYCTLCGSAQAYFTDDVPPGVETPVLRTSGLLSRSNKVMYDLVTKSVFDTFTGDAVSGPLREKGVVLNQATVVTTTWGEWKAAHPETTIVARDGGIGHNYPLDPLRGRDDDGPIFPIGDLDGRLTVHEQVFGVVLDDGTPVAFPVDAAVAALESGRTVELAGVSLRLDGGGVRAVDAAGVEIEGHQAFWFAWSQFRPDTLLWEP